MTKIEYYMTEVTIFVSADVGTTCTHSVAIVKKLGKFFDTKKIRDRVVTQEKETLWCL